MPMPAHVSMNAPLTPFIIIPTAIAESMNAIILEMIVDPVFPITPRILFEYARSTYCKRTFVKIEKIAYDGP